METKEEIIAIIRNAKLSHKRWLENAVSLIEGMPLDKNQVPVNSTDCSFGQWYYGDGQSLKSISVYREIETYHDALHRAYREIFVILFGEESHNISFLARLFGQANKLPHEKQLLARGKLPAVEQHSKAIMKKLDELEGMISAMAPEQIHSFLKK